MRNLKVFFLYNIKLLFFFFYGPSPVSTPAPLLTPLWDTVIQIWTLSFVSALVVM